MVQGCAERKGKNACFLFEPGRAVGVEFGEFEPQAVRWSATSRASAQRIKTHAPSLRDRVRAAFRDARERGLTDQEGQQQSGIVGDSWRPRRCELVQAGKLRDSGQRRRTASGDFAVVWVEADGAA